VLENKVAANLSRVRLTGLWLNQIMFARKIRVEYERQRAEAALPTEMADSFSMRSFYQCQPYLTIPCQSLTERWRLGTSVPLDKLREAMEDWFHRKSYLPKNSKVVRVKRI